MLLTLIVGKNSKDFPVSHGALRRARISQFPMVLYEDQGFPSFPRCFTKTKDFPVSHGALRRPRISQFPTVLYEDQGFPFPMVLYEDQGFPSFPWCFTKSKDFPVSHGALRNSEGEFQHINSGLWSVNFTTHVVQGPRTGL